MMGTTPFFFVDPPYLFLSNLPEDKQIYPANCRLSEHDHRKLAEVLRESKGKVMLCGYDNELYDNILGEKFHKFYIPSYTGLVNTKKTDKSIQRIETIWCNYVPSTQQDMFQQQLEKGGTTCI